MKKFFQSKGFIVSSLALLCITILGVCWFVSRDRTGDFRPDESPPSSVTGDWSDGGTQTDGDINMGSDVALAGIERISTLLAQIAFSYIVFCSYQKKTYRYLILAICLHSMYDFPLVLLDYSVSPFIFEIGLFLFSAILLLFTLKGVRGIHSNEKNN